MLTTEEAKVVWGILVDYAGASRSDDSWMKDDFIHYVTSDRPLYEFRFMGNLGGGGKFYLEHNRWRVSHYTEDSTDLRKRIESQTNAVLEGARRAFRDIASS